MTPSPFGKQKGETATATGVVLVSPLVRKHYRTTDPKGVS